MKNSNPKKSGPEWPALEKTLSELSAGNLSLPEAYGRLKNLPFEDLGFAKLDHHRRLRKGFPEVVFAAGKTVPQLKKIIAALAGQDSGVLVTRLDGAVGTKLKKSFPKAVHNSRARALFLPAGQKPPELGQVGVLSAGTSDLPVAEEAAFTAECLGARVERIYDVGVAGIHRLFAHLPKLEEAAALIVVAGMEGALPSVVGGLVDKPVIAVPACVGCGT
ncbi:MAG: nickel pincer cofactor biosynthesis protein LarB, partial [candidate division Zixibacteria bacterium]|nr:nickel pincer cofactor biosynthesis protein LarB [candidate division Zixibacteria bacterium]